MSRPIEIGLGALALAGASVVLYTVAEREVRDRAARVAATVAAFVIFVYTMFRPTPPIDLIIKGATIGTLYGLTAVGVILIYRTNRIINFASAALGAVPASLAILLQVKKGMPWALTIPIIVIGGLALGAAVNAGIIRFFATAPRLILTVATLGVVQVLAFINTYIPIWLNATSSDGSQAQLPRTPFSGFDIRNAKNVPLVTGDHIFGTIVVIGLSVGLVAFFKYTRIGIALRASAENADRALLLGIPVRQVELVAWMIAGLFGAVTIWLRAPLVGVAADGSLGFNVLLYTLAAAVCARMEKIPIALGVGVAIGIIEQVSVFSSGKSDLASALMLALVLGALLLQRKSESRAYDAGTSSWQSVKEYRPVPTELRGHVQVRTVYGGLGLAGAVIVLAAPYLVNAGRIGILTDICLFGIVAVSMVVLTGWAGQVSLGQFGLVGAGAAVAGGLAVNNNVDFFVAILAGVLAGVAVAVLIGIPAIRVQGLYLAVTTLAFGGAMEFFFLKKDNPVGRLILPRGDAPRVGRPLLLGRIDLTNDRSMYYVCLFFLAVAVLAARSFRRNRSGRVLIAARDNSRAAPAYSINLLRTRLAAFAVSGAIAALAGALRAYSQQSVDASAYGIIPSIQIFLVVVIGGLTSLPGAVIGTITFKVFEYFVQSQFKFAGATFLFTGPLLVFNLVTNPGGFSEGVYRTRDKWLRRIAIRDDILVPSLVADRRVEAAQQNSAIETAEHRVEEADGFDVHEPHITCPTCGTTMGLAEAATHEHLRSRQPVAGS